MRFSYHCLQSIPGPRMSACLWLLRGKRYALTADSALSGVNVDDVFCMRSPERIAFFGDMGHASSCRFYVGRAGALLGSRLEVCFKNEKTIASKVI